MSTEISRFVDEMLRTGEYSASEFRRAIGKHPSTIRRIGYGEAAMDQEEVRDLNQWLQRADDTRFSEVLNLDSYMTVKRPDGTARELEALAKEFFQAGGRFFDAMEAGEHEIAEEQLSSLRDTYFDAFATLERAVAKKKVCRS